jgi:hypothetical protein
LNCNNLNFSFRKKCNRCKVQTREDNERLSQYYYNSVPQPYFYIQEKENFPSLCPQSSQPLSSSLPSPHHSPQPKQTRLKPELRNRPDPRKMVGWTSERESFGEEVQRHCWPFYIGSILFVIKSKRGGLFENESMWANIDLNYL